MKIEKLNETHADAIRHLFYMPKFMGVDPSQNYFVGKEEDFVDYYHKMFCQTYLSELQNYHAFGAVDDDGQVQALIAFYESNEDPSWYWSHVRSKDSKQIKLILDAVVSYNESNNRYKFYSMFPLKYDALYRRLAFSKQTSERYGAFNEFYIKAREKCVYNLPWQILYNRTLVPVDTVVRCTYLKPEYRTLTSGGNL